MRQGLSEEDVQAALGDLTEAKLPARTVAALRLADCLTSDQPKVDEAQMADLRAVFSDGEILELAAALAVGSGWQKMIEAFGIRPDAWNGG